MSAIGSADTIWVASTPDPTDLNIGHLVRIDPAANEIDKTIALDFQPGYAAIGDGTIWVGGNNSVARFDLETGELLATIDVPPPAGLPSPPPTGTPAHIIFADGSLWATTGGDLEAGGTVVRIDPRTNEVAEEVPLATFGWDLAWQQGQLWVTSPPGNTVFHVDTATGEVVGQLEAGFPVLIVAGESGIWFDSGAEHTLTRIDPTTGEVVQKVRIYECGPSLAAGAGAIWVTDNLNGVVLCIDPAT
jgi:outer membrane protein assembly factor BamB